MVLVYLKVFITSRKFRVTPLRDSYFTVRRTVQTPPVHTHTIPLPLSEGWWEFSMTAKGSLGIVSQEFESKCNLRPLEIY